MSEEFEIRSDGFSETDKELEIKLRPLVFTDFSGQKKIVENLKIFVLAARQRDEALGPRSLTWSSGSW